VVETKTNNKNNKQMIFFILPSKRNVCVIKYLNWEY